jgi:hypothetical protein
MVPNPSPAQGPDQLRAREPAFAHVSSLGPDAPTPLARLSDFFRRETSQMVTGGLLDQVSGAAPPDPLAVMCHSGPR